MPFYNEREIKYYQFSMLDIPGVHHAIFTRHGGISPSPWKSLNFGGSVGDNLDRVQQNREKALNTLNIRPDKVFDVYQIHSNVVKVTERALFPNEDHSKADAIITNKPGITLLMRFADCVPILLFDPAKHVIGIVHAGWIGTVNKIAAKTVGIMIKEFRIKPEDIIAGIGPSIGPDHYSVGDDVLQRVKISFGDFADKLINHDNGKDYFNLWKANTEILNQVGVEKIEISGICTSCNKFDWYTHRGEHGKTGRFGAVIRLD